jgi:hypothetical protein
MVYWTLHHKFIYVPLHHNVKPQRHARAVVVVAHKALKASCFRSWLTSLSLPLVALKLPVTLQLIVPPPQTTPRSCKRNERRQMHPPCKHLCVGVRGGVVEEATLSAPGFLNHSERAERTPTCIHRSVSLVHGCGLQC